MNPPTDTPSGRARGRRLGARLFIWTVLSLSALGVVGVAGAVVVSHTAAGREAALDLLLASVGPAINGSLTVGSVSPGGLLGGATLHEIRIVDNEGHTVLAADSARASYSIAQLLGARPGIDLVELWSPRLDLAPPDGRSLGLDSLLVSGDDGGGAAATEAAEAEGEAGGFLLRGARINGGTVFVRTSGGERKEIRGIEGTIPRVEKRPGPESAVMIDVESLALAYPIRHGWLKLQEIRGSILALKETVTLEVDHFELPASEGRGSVRVLRSEEGRPALFDLQMERLALADLAWLDERLDAGTARGGVRIEARPATLRVDLSDGEAELGSARLGFAGAFTVFRSSPEPTRFEGLALKPTRFPTSELNRWLAEPAPVAGLLSGDIGFDGSRARLSVAGDLELLPEGGGEPAVRLSGAGTILGSGELEGVSLNAAGLDYALLGIFAPEVPWQGTGDLAVRLDGVLGTGMAVEVVANQTGGGGAASSVAVDGTVYGDTAISVVDLRLRMDPLSLTTLGQFYPEFPLAGEIGGELLLSGPLDRLQFATHLQTAAGRLNAEGRLNTRDPAAGYRLAASVEGFRLSELFDGLPDPFTVTGSAALSGRGLDLETVRSSLVLGVDSVTIGQLALDTVGVRAWVDEEGLLQVAAVHAEAGGMVLQGRGSLGTVDEAGVGVTLSLSAPTVRPLRELFMGENRIAWDELLPIEQSVLELEGVDPDTFPRAADLRFDGRAEGRIEVKGSLPDLAASAAVSFANLEYGRMFARAVQADFTLEGVGLRVPDPSASDEAGPGNGEPVLNVLQNSRAPSPPPGNPVVIDGTLEVDSVVFRDRRYQSARMEGAFTAGRGGRVRALVTRSDTESYEAQGVISLREEGGRVNLDQLTLRSGERRWNLRGPARFEWNPDAVLINDFGLIRPGTEGLRVRADGRLARAAGESDFELEITDMDLGVVGSFLQVETPPTGLVMANLRATGTGHEPEWLGTVEITDVESGSLRFDRVAADGSFADGLLEARLESWSQGRRNLRASGAIPMDLRLIGGVDRFLDEPLDVRIVPDSFPAAMVLGGLRSLEEIEGTVSGDVRLRGRPSSLEPEGSLHLEDAEATVYALGIRLSSTEIDLGLDPSGVMTVDGSAESGGTITFRGTVGGEGPIDDIALDLAFWAQEFQIVDRTDIETAVTGDSVTLTGSFSLPFIEGALDVNGGTVFIEEFQRTAETVNFYDPALLSAATAQLGAGSGEAGSAGVGERSPFLQNLRVLVDLHLDRGNSLRSRRMTVEPSGDLTLTFDRARNRLILVGETEVVRGRYDLGPSTLTITEGVFTFPGTPGFDPGIDVTAVTRVPTRDGEPLEITTSITGTLLRPTPAFTSDAAYAIPEPELLSLLILGRPTTSLLGDGGAASVGAGRALLFSQLANELEYVVTEKLAVDYLSVSQSDQGQAATALGTTSVQVEVGWYVRDDIFFTGVFQRGFCADPTVPVSSGGARVEVELPRDVNLEVFLEGRCTRDRYRGLGDASLELAHIWGFLFFREWGY